MARLNGTLKAEGAAVDFTGCRVDLYAPGPERETRLSARADAAGAFAFDLPPEAKSGQPLRIVAFAPSGKQIAEAAPEASGEDQSVDLPVADAAALGAVPLAQPDQPVAPPPIRFQGLVISPEGKAAPAGLTVLLYEGSPQDAGAGVLVPFLTRQTDRSGYFFGEVPDRGFALVSAYVMGAPAPVGIALEAERLPTKLVVVTELPGAGEGKDDCGCAATGGTARTPTQADIANSPDGFSVDLGSGQCVSFNAPNRAIEEFDFYSVVRTTEPDITGFNFTDPPTLDLVAHSAALAELEDRRRAAQEALARAEGVATVAQQAADRARRVNAAAGVVGQNANLSPLLTALMAQMQALLGPDWQRAGAVTTFVAAVTPPLTAAGQQNAAGDLAEALADRLVEEDREGLRRVLEAGIPIGYAAQTWWSAFAGATQTALGQANAALAAAQATAVAARTTLAEAQQSYDVEVAAQSAQETYKKELVAFRLKKNAAKPLDRAPLTARNPIDWDDAPTFYQAAEIAHGHLLHFKQTWYADGYSLGDLLYSLPLAPGQKKMISVLEWNRQERASRAEAQTLDESLSAGISRDRDLDEVVSGTLTETARGGSRSTSAGVGVGTGAAGNGSYQGFNFGALLGVSGGYGEANSSAWQDAARSLSTSSMQTLRDRTMQSASAVRGLRSTVVQGINQGEALRATTEVVANHNHCHAMTVQYFEVLRHLKLEQELVDVRECLFVPLQMSAFDVAKTLRWRQELATYLQQPSLAPGFEALRRVASSWRDADAPQQRYADEPMLWLSGELTLTVHIPLPPFPEPVKPDPADTAGEVVQQVQEALNPTTGFLGALLAVATGGMSLVVGAATNAVTNVAREAAKGASGLARELSQEDAQTRYARFHNDIVPGVVAAFVDSLALIAVVDGQEVPVEGADFTLVSTYQPGIPLAVSVRADLPGTMTRGALRQLIVRATKPLPLGCSAIVNGANLTYRTQRFEHALAANRRINDDIEPPRATVTIGADLIPEVRAVGGGRGAAIYTPVDAWEQRNLRAEDKRLAVTLIDHLNDNLEYYHHAIWWAMDPNRRYMLLDGCHAPNSGGRSVASVVDNRLIGIVGNSLILPVADGVHLDPRFRFTEEGSTAKLIDYYQADRPPATRISLPTRGVFAEAVMGQCNACEVIDDSRFWRWEQSPIDEPPGIDAISTGSRAGTPSVPTPSAFPTPLVNIQTAADAPAPSGLAAALQTLGQDAFRDITGLAGTQQNAAAAYSAALDTAFKFGKEASTLAQQAALLGSKDRTLSAIDRAEQDGKIDAATAKDLRTTAFKKMIGDTTDPGKSEEDAKKKIALVDELKTGGGITGEDAREHNNAIVKGTYSDGSAKTESATDRSVSNLVERVPIDQVQGIKVTSPSGGSVEVTNPPATETADDRRAIPYPELFRELFLFRPAAALQLNAAARGVTLQPIEEGRGDVNYDSYRVRIGTKPRNPATGQPFTAADFFEHVRRNFADFLMPYPLTGKPVSLAPYAAGDATTWDSASPEGTLMLFDIGLGRVPSFSEQGIVMCGESGQTGVRRRWTFSTMHGPMPIGNHPVSGNRQFGLIESGADWYWYIYACDRVGTWVEWLGNRMDVVVEGQREYWLYFQQKLKAFVEANGGTATVMRHVDGTVGWDIARQLVRGDAEET